MKFYNLLAIVWVIHCCVNKILRIVRGAEKPTGPKLPDFSLYVLFFLSVFLFLMFVVYMSFIGRHTRYRSKGDELYKSLKAFIQIILFLAYMILFFFSMK